ncbi:nuclear transport factor 2 family protein [Deinococcus detaillensis]|uniref:Nuclear transport factor 2 family protein n=1 Tax=Deinococcus detaillensis TaxID=2592048 RepID=A0A553V6K6_9DEIO|nr:nuclear transport factor 2 family protein [Deinococcus detaillensis]
MASGGGAGRALNAFSDDIAGLDDFLTINAVLILDDAWNAAYQNRDAQALNDLIADDWSGFLPDGQVISKAVLQRAITTYPEDVLVFRRQVAQLYGDTAITRGELSANGVHAQSHLRVYARRAGKWQAVAVQVVP